MTKSVTRSEAEQQAQPQAERLLQYQWAVGAAREKDVLDVGCGDGDGTAYIASVGTARRCVGVESLDRANNQPRNQEAIAEVELVACDLGRLPFDDDSFDLVTSFETIEHVEDPGAMVAELARVLRPRGALLISTRGAQPAEFESLLSGSFADVRQLRASSELNCAAVCLHGAVEDSMRQTLLAQGEQLWGLIGEIERLRNELFRMREAATSAERQVLELREHRSVTMAELERKLYWLERAEIDPEAWMRRRPLALVFRILQKMRRLRWRLLGRH